MKKSEVFCTVPWFEVHINADGTYHTCGAQLNHMSGSDLADRYNVHSMTIDQWMDSEWQRQSRLDKLLGSPSNLCNMCYHEEKVGSSSKRQRENLKSGITAKDFSQTWASSPDKHWFEWSSINQGRSNYPRPTSYHISLGNECNLACHMCGPTASSRIAAELKQQGIWEGAARLNWTDDDRAWNMVVDHMCTTANLRWIHVIGGEPLLNPKFAQLVQRLKASGRTDIYFGFTTNGTVFDKQLLDDLSCFHHVDIGISVECLGPLNSAIRRGSNTTQVLKNIERYLQYRKKNQIYVTVRTVPSALSVHTLDQLYAWCRDREIDVMSNVLTYPHHLAIKNLPARIKNRLLAQYSRWNYCDNPNIDGDPRDPTLYREHIDSEVRAIITALQAPNDQHMTDKLMLCLEQWGWLENSSISNYFLELDDQ